MDKVLLAHDLPRAAREVRVLQRLHHQHICQLFQVIETERMYYLILEFCPGGELFDYIVAREKLKVRALVDTSTLVAELPVEPVASCSKYSQNIPLPW